VHSLRHSCITAALTPAFRSEVNVLVRE